MAEWHTRYAKDVVEKSMQVQVLSRPPKETSESKNLRFAENLPLTHFVRESKQVCSR